ncbi:hypothetical protein TIFTF001_002142 [Ficus carica]|uniref:Uncharacterized protein n=1 Tax=Ficus carica TaxID=3494 RepID=A0AA87ZBX7_FICCA|nr:hypothetical protein TIFTF001_002142 [Ficus carica]
MQWALEQLENARCSLESNGSGGKLRPQRGTVPDEDEEVFEDETLLLYEKIHANSFGHLLVINGIEGGSNNLVGFDILELWDGFCKFLQAQNISATDASKKRAMELRLLYGEAYGHTWFGKCGYSFDHGSFGINESDYRRALGALSTLNRLFWKRIKLMPKLSWPKL